MVEEERLRYWAMAGKLRHGCSEATKVGRCRELAFLSPDCGPRFGLSSLSLSTTMSTQRPSRISLPPATPVSPSPGPTPDNLTSGGGGGRAVSFSASRPRRQSASRWRQLVDDESGLEPAGPPPIPSAVQPAGDTTPLPMLSMIVLSIVSVQPLAACFLITHAFDRRCLASFCLPTYLPRSS
jgi:hypothetical protein